MRTLSKWARKNPVVSRFLITSLHLLSIVNAVLLGILLYLGDWPSSTVPTVLLAIIFCATFLLYPKAKGRLTTRKYRRQKLCDFTLVFSGVLFLAFSVNNYLAAPSGNNLELAAGVQPTIQMAALGQDKESKEFLPPTKAEVRKAKRSQIRELKASIKVWKKAHKGNKKGVDAGQTLLVLLVIFGAILAAILLAALTCTLACSGAGGLAILLILAGLTGIVLLSVVLIRNII